jgi:hypothetical protein
MKNICVMLLLLTALIVKGQEMMSLPGFLGNKYYEDYNKISYSTFKRKLETVPAAAQSYKSFRTNNTMAILTAIATGLLWAQSASANWDNRTYNISTIAVGTISTIFSYVSNERRNHAILLYNAATTDKSSSSIYIAPSSSGVGFALQF